MKNIDRSLARRIRVPAIFLLPLLLLLTLLPIHALAQSPSNTPVASDKTSVDPRPHPILPQDSSWAGVMIIIILGAFLAAAVIGPIVRANTPDELPTAHSHDEPPGTSGRHGVSGTDE